MTMQCKAGDTETGPQTYEILLMCPIADQPVLVAGLRRYGGIRIIDHGLRSCAVVTGLGDAVYFIVTDGQPNLNALRDWKTKMRTVTCGDLRKLPEIARVVWARHFTRFSQRRFGWGDAYATREEVVAAVRDESSADLLAIMPEAAPLVHRGELQQLPAMFDALHSGLPALADCKHQFFTEGMRTYPRVRGPCGACGKEESDAYKQGFTKCSECDSVQCKPCAMTAVTDQDRQQSLLRAYHEVKNSHTWTASQDDCDLCGKGPSCGCGGESCSACLADVRTKQCSCGIVRCDKCLHVHSWTDAASAASQPGAEASSSSQTPPQPQAATPVQTVTECTCCGQAPRKVCVCGEARCEACFMLMGGSMLDTWYQAHPHHGPATCHVTGLSYMKDSVKLEWLAFELGDGTRFVDFARKFHELFGVDSPKAVCLELYRKYAGIVETAERGSYRTVAEARKLAYSMECQVPPGELEEFQKLWNADAPRRCHEDHCTMPVDAPLGKRFCAKHADAGKSILCTRAIERSEDADGEVVTTHCGGKIVYRNGCRVCTACDTGTDVAELLEKSTKLSDSTALNQSIKRGASSLRIANNAWRFSSQNDPDHVASWTKKRRL